MKREKYASKSERIEDENRLIFNEIEQEELNALEKTETITYVRKKGRTQKKLFAEELEREEVVVNLPESERVCPHDATHV